MGMLIRDVRYALRWLVRRPRFTVAAVLLLAIGIGFTSAAFSVVNWLLIRPVSGISDDGRLATVWFEEHNSDGSRRGVSLSYPNYADVLRGVTALRGMTGFHSLHVSTASPNGVADPVVGEFATANYAHVLGIGLQLGRWFDNEDDQPPFGSPVVVVSDRIWRNVFNGDPNVLGKVLEVRDRQFTVVGVAPPGFHGTDRFGETDLWLPGRTETYVTHSPRPATIQEREWGGFWSFVARLAPEATLPQARDQLQAGIHSLAVVVPEVTGYFTEVHPQVVAGVGVDPSGRLKQEAVFIMVDHRSRSGYRRCEPRQPPLHSRTQRHRGDGGATSTRCWEDATRVGADDCRSYPRIGRRRDGTSPRPRARSSVQWGAARQGNFGQHILRLASLCVCVGRFAHSWRAGSAGSNDDDFPSRPRIQPHKRLSG